MEPEIIEQLRGLNNTYPGMNRLHLSTQYLLRCASYEQFCKTLRALVEPQQYCALCKTQLAPEYAASRWMLLTAKTGDLLIVPKLHLRSRFELTAEDRQQIRQVRDAALTRFNLDPKTTVAVSGMIHDKHCSIEHAHFKLVPRDALRPVKRHRFNYPAAYARLLGYAERALDEPHGFGSILNP